MHGSKINHWQEDEIKQKILVPVTEAFFQILENIISTVAVTIENTVNNRKYILIVLETLRK